MSEWKLKRFWKDANVQATETGHQILLDGRVVRTPAKSVLEVPTNALAEAIAGEWQAQGDTIDPLTMPMTRAANAAIDKVAVQFDEVADLIAAYGDSDLICYRADHPEGLVAAQSDAWDPLVDWARAEFGISLDTACGVIHRPQSESSLNRLSEEVHRFTPFCLTALHDLVGLSGSLVIGLAATRRWAPAENLWDRSRVDENWQIREWGPDEEEEKVSAARKESFLAADRFFHLASIAT